jgi:cytochrome c-type biogenesis protein CcmH/NrfG
MGIVRAFGKQDLKGASEAWERVVSLSPDSAEGRAAKQALDAVKTAHPDLTGATAPGTSRGSE